MLDLQKFPHKVDYVADNVCWENTLHNLDRGRDSGHIVTEMVCAFHNRHSENLLLMCSNSESYTLLTALLSGS